MKAVDSRRGLYYSETFDKLHSPKILNSSSSNVLHLPDIKSKQKFQFQSNRNLDLHSQLAGDKATDAEERDSMASLDNLLGLRATDIFNAELKRMHEIRKTSGASQMLETGKQRTLKKTRNSKPSMASTAIDNSYQTMDAKPSKKSFHKRHQSVMAKMPPGRLNNIIGDEERIEGFAPILPSRNKKPAILTLNVPEFVSRKNSSSKHIAEEKTQEF